MELAEAKAKTGEESDSALPLLEVDGVSIRFGGVTALQDVSFRVAGGAICGLIGPNGAGKTTLFNCISRLYEPHSGAILFHGRPVAASPGMRWPGSASPARSRTSRSFRR